MRHRDRREAHQQVRHVDIVLADDRAGRKLRRLVEVRMLPFRPTRKPGEDLFGLLQNGRAVHVAGDHQDHVVRHVPAPIELEDVVAGDLAEGLPVADHAMAAGVRPEHGLREGVEEPRRRARHAGAHLALDDAALAVVLLLRDAGVHEPVGEQFHGLAGVDAEGADVIAGVVLRGVGVHLAAEVGDELVGVGLGTCRRRAAGDEMLGEVAHARAEVLALVHAPHAHVHAHRRHRGRTVLVNVDLKPVLERLRDDVGGGGGSGGEHEQDCCHENQVACRSHVVASLSGCR